MTDWRQNLYLMIQEYNILAFPLNQPDQENQHGKHWLASLFLFRFYYLSIDAHPLCRPQLFQSKDAPNKTTTPEEFIRMTKGITMATAKAVAAGNSARQEDIIHTANLSRKAISDMLTTCKVHFFSF